MEEVNKVKYSDWMGDEGEESDEDLQFDKERFEGLDGHMRL